MKKLLLLGLFMLFAFPAVSYCEITSEMEIRYTARLKKYTDPITASTKVEFRYYKGGNENGGGTQIYSETHNVTPNSSGIFTVTLNPDLKYSDWRAGDIWVGISVNNNSEELRPREKLMAQPYAIHSKTSGNGVPPGTIIAFAGPVANAPAGYLLCDGQSYPRSKYPDLFEAIDTVYGGVGTNDFNVPDFRGVFLRGAGSQTVNISTKGADPSANKANVIVTANPLAQVQGDAIRNLEGELNGLDFHGGMTESKVFKLDGGAKFSYGWSFRSLE